MNPGKRSASLFLSFAVLVLVLPSCGDQVQKAKPPAESAPQVTLPPDHPTIGQGAATHPSRPIELDPFADPVKQPARQAMNAAAPSQPERVVFAGEVSIDPAVQVGEKFTVFITAVYAKEERAPVLIKRFDSPKFPFPFEIQEKDVGMGARKSDKPLYLRAMISDTGEAMKTRNRTTSDQSYPLFTKDIKLAIKP